MALNLYIEVVGMKQGTFPGESEDAQHQHHLIATGFAHEWVAPSPGAGRAGAASSTFGKLTFVRRWGPASTSLYAALLEHEYLPTVSFEFWHSTNDSETLFRTVLLKKAFVQSIEQVADATGDAEGLVDLERVSLRFQEMTIDNHPGIAMISYAY